MARAKGPARPRGSASPSPGSAAAARGPRRRKSGFVASAGALALRPVTPVVAFFLTPGGLAVAVVLILAAALPWFKIPEVLDAFRRSVLQATGAMCYLLVLDLLAVALVPAVWSAQRRNHGFWRVTAGAQALGLFL